MYYEISKSQASRISKEGKQTRQTHMNTYQLYSQYLKADQTSIAHLFKTAQTKFGVYVQWKIEYYSSIKGMGYLYMTK